MRELANDLTRHALSRNQLTFPDDLAFAGLIMQFEQYALADFQWRCTAVETELASRRFRLQCPETDRNASGHGAFTEFNQLIGVQDDFSQRMTESLPVAEAQQILCREIEVRHDQLVVERNDGDTQAAE
jgi:hypothetical protein